MSLVVGQVGGGWDEDATTTDYSARAARHRNLLRAVLLLHERGPWEPAEVEAWRVLTGTREVSIRALCAAIRASGISVEELLR